MMRVLGIIPARGGSKTVPRKNIRLVGGKPLIAYTIQAARESRSISCLVTSTEDDEIAGICTGLGCEVVKRPAELAGDDTPTLPVVQHVFQVLESRDEKFDYGVLLQPTSPLRTGEDIDKALTILDETGADSVVSVYQVRDHHPARMYRLVDGRLVPYGAEATFQRRQDLPAVYHRNGAIYAFRRGLPDRNTLLGEDIRPYIMTEERSLNIDNENDLLLADLLLGRQG